MRKRGLFGLTSALALGAANTVWAASVAIDPVRLHLPGANRAQVLNVRNQGDKPVRFQVTAFAWAQSPLGEMQLSPTTDLVFFPSLFEIKPKDTRKIRVTSVVAAVGRERSYRLFIDELPAPSSEGSGVQVLTRLGVPIFLQPATPRPQPQVQVAIVKGQLVATLENQGNSYLLASSLEVAGNSRSGLKILQQSLPTWYVLAGGRRDYQLPLQGATCENLAELKIVVKTDHGTVRSQHTPTVGSCNPL